MITTIIGLIIALVVGVALGWFISHAKADADTNLAGGIVEAARKEVENMLRDARAKAQDEAFKARDQFDRETKDRRQELGEMEKRVMQRESILDRKVDLFDRKTEEVALKEAKLQAESEAKQTITIAIERCASNHVQTATSCTVTLPSEEMKGRIIGREGRNIRAFESATGINVLIDDTPQAVVLSGFDPVRRELARQTLEHLVLDGRINPARIEEEVAKVSEELETLIHKAGEDAVFRVGLQKVHPEVMKLLGRLKFRHSFAQNVLDHSVEVAGIEGMLAAELGLNQQIAKRVGLFHDIGKAVDHEVEGSHAMIGAEFLKKYGEPEEVWQGVACHHHEVEPLTTYGDRKSTRLNSSHLGISYAV